ncbi:TPA: hypothetical protein U1C38_000391 [Streptococcus suis]|nr:hypothetical protein [Streptococcus suis]
MMIDEIKETLKHYHNAISELSSFDIEGHCDCAESCIAVNRKAWRHVE